ncbi:MAG: methyl-accepting chemotaxis protein [Methylococcaceae bacterium]|nr:methyl-accepting chemotaxis protein [Methylococcaceae bacterium]
MNDQEDLLKPIRTKVDGVMMATVTFVFMVTVIVGFIYEEIAFSLTVGIPAVVMPFLIWRASPGTLLSRLAMASAFVIQIAIQIQASHGLIEMHFGVFVILAFLLAYRDWRAIVFAAALIAVHHLSCNFLQAAQQDVWIFRNGANLGVVLLHAAYVVFESVILVFLAVQLRIEGVESATVAFLAKRIGEGDLSTNIVTTQKDANGGMLHSMKMMQQQLLERISANQQLLEQSTRLKMAMDNISVNVMVADSARNIIYMNPAVLRMLHSAETDIKKSLPHFDVNKLMGANIDSFHKNPAHQKGMLANLVGTHKAEINIAGHIFSLTANPITDAEGQRLGTVVEWLDRTAEILIEQEVTNVVGAAVAGDFTHQVSEQNKQGFSLLLAQSINKLLATNATSLADLARVLDALSSGDLTSTIDEDYAGTYGQLKDSTNATVGNLRQSISDIKDAIISISMASKEIAAGNNDLSHRTEEQASSLEQTAASMQELTSTVKHNSDNAKHANELAVSATEIAGKGVEVVGQVVDTMESIHESSRKIVDIISVIDGIAFQTNILALNAAVEAARAGEQGRGFAVVAGEVRNLAQRAAAAAGEIKALIGNSVEQIEDGTRLVTHAGKTMEDIVNSIRGVTVIMSQIASASVQQTSGIEQVNLAIGQMDEVTQQNAALVEQAAAAAESLEEQTQNLNSTVGQFIVDSHGAGRSKIITYPTAKNIATTPTKAKAQPQKVASNNQEWEEF